MTRGTNRDQRKPGTFFSTDGYGKIGMEGFREPDENGTAGRGRYELLEIISYRFSVSAEWGYAYYAGTVPLGGTSCQVSTSSTVRITGESLVWYSQFRIMTDIVPGISRRVKDNMTEREVYRIIFWQPGLYQVAAETERGRASLNVEERKGMYLFGEPGMPVAAITERIQEAEYIPPSRYSLEPVFRTTFFDGDTSEGFRMMILSFPALKMI